MVNGWDRTRQETQPNSGLMLSGLLLFVVCAIFFCLWFTSDPTAQEKIIGSNAWKLKHCQITTIISGPMGQEYHFKCDEGKK